MASKLHHLPTDERSPDDVRAAIDALFREHYQGLCCFVLRYVGARDLAEEIVQELFLRIWEKQEAGGSPEQLAQPYLYGAARNLAINLLQHERVEKRYAARAILESSPRAVAADANLERDELANTIQSALERLPQRCRLVFTLSRDRHMTYPEIAQALGVTVKAVEFHMGRALKYLRDAIS